MMKKIFLCLIACLMIVGCGKKEDKNISTMTGKEKLVVAFGGNTTPFSYVKMPKVNIVYIAVVINF